MTPKLDHPRPLVQVAVLALALALSLIACVKPPSHDQVKASMQITDVSTKWVSKYYQPWPPRLILVPSITFRVKNVSAKTLTYVDFNAIFKAKGQKENLGDSFYAAIRGEGVAPGETSPAVTLKSNFGVEGRNLASFHENPNWRPFVVKLFAFTHGSQPVLMGEYDVDQTIDFQEPAPVVPVKPEEKKETKK